MSGLPPPPDDFASLKLIVERCAPRDLLRVASDDRSSWCRFNREPRNRFDSPHGDFGVLYAAFDLPTAFAETVLRQKPASIAAGFAVPIALSELISRTVVYLDGQRDLRLIRLYDYGLAAGHSDNRLSTVDDYPTTQLWAQEFYQHPAQADGLIYLSRFMGARRAVALFDRCADAIGPSKIVSLLEHPDLAGLLQNFDLAVDRDA